MQEKRKTIILGTRSSKLALWQAEYVKNEIEKIFPHIDVMLSKFVSKGDKILDTALSKIGDKGLFTKELEESLLNGSIDLAVHSLKDLETTLSDGLMIAAITKRHDPRDVLIAREKGTTIQTLPENAIVATSSLRRASQIKNIRPDITIVDVRGNVPTRVQKFLDSSWDGMILAAAGLERLEMEEYISSYIEPTEMIPAVGQGALGIEINSNSKDVLDIVKGLHDESTYYETLAERSLLRTLEGGCQVPVGAYATISNGVLTLTAYVGALDGSSSVRESINGAKENAEVLGISLAEKLCAGGAEKILNEIRQ